MSRNVLTMEGNPVPNLPRVAKLGQEAIIRIYGSEARYWQAIARQSKTSLPHLKLLTEYTYGKPRNVDADREATVSPVIDMRRWA